MDDNDLTALARGVVPFVHEAIAEALAKMPPPEVLWMAPKSPVTMVPSSIAPSAVKAAACPAITQMTK